MAGKRGRVGVFPISTQMVLKGSDAELRAISDGLRERHIALAVATGMSAYTDRCGAGTQGCANERTADAAALKIKRLGGVIDDMRMDEPVFYAHEPGQACGGQRGCKYSIGQIVTETVAKVAWLAGVKGTLLEPISSHGLRAGFVTAADRNTVPGEEIMGHSRHRSLTVIRIHATTPVDLQHSRPGGSLRLTPAGLPPAGPRQPRLAHPLLPDPEVAGISLGPCPIHAAL